MAHAPVQIATLGLAVRTTAQLAAVAVANARGASACVSMAGLALTAQYRSAATVMANVLFRVFASATRAGLAGSVRSRRCVLILTALATALASWAAATVPLAGQAEPAS